MNEWQEMVFGPPLDGSEVWLRTESGHEFRARYMEGFINSDNRDCETWVASDDDHPPCWTDGAFWEVNEDEKQSSPPTHWRVNNPEAN